MLSRNQIKFYKDNGFIFPFPVLNNNEVNFIKNKLNLIEHKTLASELRKTRNLIFITEELGWDLVHNSRIIDPISNLLGPNILLWGMNVIIKKPGPTYVSYHQDVSYWGLYPYNIATAWIAISNVSLLTGPLKFIPKSHKGPVQKQIDTYDKNNLLSRGQTVNTKINENDVVTAILKQGEMSIHHVGMIHGSDENCTNEDRIGIALRYCSTDVKQTKSDIDYAILVKGQDEYKNFQLIPRPNKSSTNQTKKLSEDFINIRTQTLMKKN